MQGRKAARVSETLLNPAGECKTQVCTLPIQLAILNLTISIHYLSHDRTNKTKTREEERRKETDQNWRKNNISISRSMYHQ